MADSAPQPLDADTAALIRRKARRLARSPGFTRSDREDLEQEIAARLLVRLARLKPQPRHRGAYLAGVVENIIRGVARDRRAAKRDPAREAPPGPAEDAEPAARDELEGVERRLDVRAAVAALPRPLRRIAERLTSAGVAEVARQLDIPRTTLYLRLREIRRRFEEAGLRDYLETSPSPRGRTGYRHS